MPLVGCVPRLVRAFKQELPAIDQFHHKLHNELGPVFRVRVIGKRLHDPNA